MIVEIPYNSFVKYEFDKEANQMRCDRVLHTAMAYPGNYGYFPHTLAGKKTDGKKTRNIRGIPKLMDANWAGGDKIRQMYSDFMRGRFSKGRHCLWAFQRRS